MKNIVLISAPAGGKGTISKYISEKYGYEHISIGDLFRNEVNNNTLIGKEISLNMKNGLLIDDQIVFKVLRNRLKTQNKNFIIDGVPRTINQAKSYSNFLNELGITLEKVIYVSTTKETALSRINNRLICKNCNSVYNSLKDDVKDNKCLKCGKELYHRDDDKKSTFEKRYEIFGKESKELLEFYGDLVYEVKNDSKIDDAFKQIDNIFKKGDND